MGLTVVSEVFADRAYGDDGLLVSRGLQGAVIHDPEEAARRVGEMVREGAIITLSGNRIPTAIDSICVHGDTPGAIPIAAAVRSGLEKQGYAITNFIH